MGAFIDVDAGIIVTIAEGHGDGQGRQPSWAGDKGNIAFQDVDKAGNRVLAIFDLETKTAATVTQSAIEL